MSEKERTLTLEQLNEIIVLSNTDIDNVAHSWTIFKQLLSE